MTRLLKFSCGLLAFLLSALLCSCATIPPSPQGSDVFIPNALPSVETTVQAADTSPTLFTEPSFEATEASPIVVTETTDPPHTHNFSEANCVSPKTCECGATEGSVTEHSWISATCSSPKTCEICGTTSGSATEHLYSGGFCKFCGETDPSYLESDNDMVWIPTKGGKKYHAHSGCSNMIDPDYVSKSEATNRGFTPCKKCY